MKALSVVCAIIEDEHGMILLAQRPPGKTLSGFWEFPGGKMEDGENAAQALQRELREELDLEVSLGRFMGIFRHSYDWGDIDLHVYVVRPQNEPRRSSDIHVFKWINPTLVNAQELTPADVKPLQAYLEQTAN